MATSAPLSLPAGTFIGVAPSDVMGDHLCMPRGLVNTLSYCTKSTDDALEPNDIAWSFIVLGEIVRNIEADLELIDEQYCKKKEPEEKPTPPKIKKMSKTRKKKLGAV